MTIGGGSGSAVVLNGLKQHDHELAAIVSMFDSGGSTGILRKEFGYPPLGDIRQCILALAPESDRTEILRNAFDFRFNSRSSLRGHSVGNLMLAALTSALENNVEEAIGELGRLLDISGAVVPITVEDAHLCAELMDGQIVWSENEINTRINENPGIRRVFLSQPVEANPVALKAITEAEVVIMGPGDLYTSVVPNFLAKGIGEILAKTEARLIYVCNVMTKRGETDAYNASHFSAVVHQYLGGRTIDNVIVNMEPVPSDVLELYRHEGAEPVTIDRQSVMKYTHCLIERPLLDLGPPVRHNGQKLAEVIEDLGAL